MDKEYIKEKLTSILLLLQWPAVANNSYIMNIPEGQPSGIFINETYFYNSGGGNM